MTDLISYSNVVTLGDVLTAGTLLGTVVAGIVSLRRFSETLKHAHYAELDKLYFEIVKLTITDPYLSEPLSAKAVENRGTYDSYAFLMFNFLETIADRAQNNVYLCQTWYPIVRHEYTLHKDWLAEANNRSRFKTTFLTFLESGQWAKHCGHMG